MVVLAGTGIAWGTFNLASSGLSTNDVIDSGFSAPDGAMDVLLVGNDSRVDAQGNPLPDHVLKMLRTTDDEGGDLTDTMILLRVPNDGKRATAISFPRDSLVDLGHGFGEAKLNSAMARAKSQERQQLMQDGVSDEKELEQRSTEAGQKFLIQTIEQLSGTSIDHYAEVNLLGFHDITKAVGGVEVCLNAPVDDSQFSGAVFPAGRQTIEGADALAFVRQRHGLPRNDLDRVVRQQVFMSSLSKKILDSGTLSNPSKLNELYSAMKKSVVLDEGWDPISFAQEMQGIAAGNIEFTTVPVELVGPVGEEDVRIKEEEARAYVEQTLLSPEEQKKQERQEAAKPEVDPSEIGVNVYNASSVSGLAASVQEAVIAEGFGEGATDNAETMNASIVRHAPGEAARGKQVAEALGGLPVEADGSVTPGNVDIYLAADYSGPGAQGFAGQKAVELDGMPRTGPMPAQEQQEQPITAGGVPCVN